MDHFIHEKYDFRLLCIRYLASRGWRWFGEELDHRQGERIDRYLTGNGDASLLDAIDEPEWYTSGILASNTDRYPKAAFDAEQRRFHEAVRRTASRTRAGSASTSDATTPSTSSAQTRRPRSRSSVR